MCSSLIDTNQLSTNHRRIHQTSSNLSGRIHLLCFSIPGLINAHWEAPKGVQRFTFRDLKNATNGFSKEHEIGAGGFGNVYYGSFSDGRTQAIKRASATGSQGITEFRNEVGF